MSKKTQEKIAKCLTLGHTIEIEQKKSVQKGAKSPSVWHVYEILKSNKKRQVSKKEQKIAKCLKNKNTLIVHV